MEFFRYEDTLYTDGVRVQERKFELIDETPKGYWIKLFSCFNDKKWVSKTSRNRFAFPTREEALINFEARKKRQIQILKAQLSNAKYALSFVAPRKLINKGLKEVEHESNSN